MAYATRYVIFFHRNFSHFIPQWRFSTLLTSSDSFIHVFSKPIFSTFFSKIFPREFFTSFPLFGFSHFPWHLISSCFAQIFYEFSNLYLNVLCSTLRTCASSVDEFPGYIRQLATFPGPRPSIFTRKGRAYEWIPYAQRPSTPFYLEMDEMMLHNVLYYM